MKKPPTAPPPRDPVERVFGLRAALAVFDARADDITAVHLDPAVQREADALLRWAASKGVTVTRGDARALAKVTGSELHEGLCVTARPRRWTTPATLQNLLRPKGFAVAVDRVRNPYNVGAVLRSAAFFGAAGMILGAQAPHPALAPLAVRVAEGGAERVALCRTTDLAETLSRLRAAGVRVLGAEAGGDIPHTALTLTGPTVLVMGHEREGLSPRVRALCDGRVSIAGSGQIESLNVGVAAGILLAALSSPRAG